MLWGGQHCFFALSFDVTVQLKSHFKGQGECTTDAFSHIHDSSGSVRRYHLLFGSAQVLKPHRSAQCRPNDARSVAPVSLLTDTTKWNQAVVPSRALNPAADFKLMIWASQMFLCSWNICESVWVTSVYSMCWSLARTLYGYKCRAESATGSGLLCRCYI